MMEFLKDDVSLRILCNACLCTGSKLNEITDEKLKQYYLDALKEIPLSIRLGIPMLCVDCRALLQKSYQFREQVKDSYRILMTYTSENLNDYLLTDVTRPARLKTQINKCIDIEPKLTDAKYTQKKYRRSCRNEKIQASNSSNTRPGPHRSDTTSVVQSARELYVKDELKVKSDDSDTDADFDTPLVDLQVDTLADALTSCSPDGTGVTPAVRSTQQVYVKYETKLESDGSDPDADFDTPLVDLQVDTLADALTSCSPDRGDVTPAVQNTKHSNIKYKMKFEYEGSDRDPGYDTSLIDLPQVDTLVEGTELDVIQENELGEYTIEQIIINKKKLKRSRKMPKIKKKPKNNEEKLDIPNIKAIHMTYNEMLEERQRESKRDSYINAEFKCENCIVGFNYSSSYKKHLHDRHSPSIGKYTCPICKTVLNTVESFYTHYKRHMKKYECSICQKRTTDLKSMQQHYYSTHEISLKQYTCAICGKISNSVDAHRYHADTHKSRLQCPDCDKTFRHRGGLLNHKLTVHEARNKFPCPHCGKNFQWKNSLKRHLPIHDENRKPDSAWQCWPCRVTFASQGSYKRHMKNSMRHVTKDHLRFICDHCDRRFADKTKLRDHIEEKHLHKTYQCTICLKTFMNRVNLDQHTRNVHKGRPNNKMCHHCGKGFPTKSQLESHIRTHTGERPFICEFCPTTFSQHSNLSKHNRQVHLNMKSKRYPAAKKKKEEIEMALQPTDIQIDYPVDIGFTM